MNLQARIKLLVQLGELIREKGDYLKAVMHQTEYNNAWFTKEAMNQSLDALAAHFLDRTKLEAWAKQYAIPETTAAKKVALVMAGNIPLVGFHDLLCVFITGHQAIIKLSEKDRFLLPYFIKWMGQQNESAKAYFTISDKLAGFDAVIATGSNNSARYFNAYFSKHPHIIRKNRNSVAILTGDETEADLIELGQDIFQYYGMGCRNVAKLWLPKGYDFDFLLQTLHDNYKHIVLHSKYKNNFDYNYAIYLLNGVKYQSNGCVLMIEQESNISRIATLHYQYYETLDEAHQTLRSQEEEIQCVVAAQGVDGLATLPFGKAQTPSLTDYPDGVDVLAFLLGIG